MLRPAKRLAARHAHRLEQTVAVEKAAGEDGKDPPAPPAVRDAAASETACRAPRASSRTTRRRRESRGRRRKRPPAPPARSGHSRKQSWATGSVHDRCGDHFEDAAQAVVSSQAALV